MKKCLSIIPILITFTLYGQTGEIMALQGRLPSLKDSLRYVDALNRLSILYYEKNTDTSLLYSRAAYDISVRRQYRNGKADALNDMGIVYDLRDNPSLAFRYYNDALNLYDDLRDSSNIVQMFLNIGVVLLEKDEIPKSLQYFHRAMVMGDKLGNDSIMSLVLIDYLTLYTDSIPRDSRTAILEKATQVATRYRDERSLIGIEQTRGVLDLADNKQAEGMGLLRAAAAKATALDYHALSMDILTELGDQFIKDRPDSALSYYMQGLRISETKGYTTYSKIFCTKLYQWYYDKRDFPRIAVFGEKLLNIYKAEQANNNSSGIDYIDYALAERELEATRARSENRKLIILILSIFCLSTLAIGVFIWQLYRLRGRHALTLEALNKAVSERNEQLQQKHEFNNKLVSLLAHDFRQPIIAAKNMAILLKEPEDFTSEELQRIIQSIEVSSDTAIDIFENILQWIKRQLSGFSYEPIPLNLRNLVDEAIRPFIALGADQHIALVNAVAQTITIHADKELLQFINRNLIHNALKFSPEHSTITIAASVADGEVVVCICDEGKGINPEKLPQLFNFKNELRYDNDKEKGAGVALMICKDFIDRMFGRIWAENAADKGAVFYYALPVH
jgi:signal transduction histidine kinase/tetratricopeptide (TPR) repeat protein